MPRRAVVPQESLGDFNAPSSVVRFARNQSLEPVSDPAPAGVQADAGRVLAQAQRVLEQTDTQRRALQGCLDVLHTADPDAYFYYSLDPATITPASGLHPGTRKARRLRPLLTTALRQVNAHQDAIRLNTLLTLSRLGIPVAVWHFLIAGPLPLTLDALLPRAAPAALPSVSPVLQETTPQRPRRGRGTPTHKRP